MRFFLVLTALFYASTGYALPDYLSSAQKYGAKDCGFCHALSSGGKGHNERGRWLIDERLRRAAEAIDIDWLAARDPLVALEPRTQQSTIAVATALPALKPLASDLERAFDYSTHHGDWPAYGGGLGANKYSPLEQVTPANLDQLAIAWVWELEHKLSLFERKVLGKTPDGFKATPLMVGGRLFVRTRFSEVEAIDPITGKTLWSFDPGTRKGKRPAQYGFSTRGLAYHRDAKGGRLLLLTTDGWLIALSPETGQPLIEFGDKGRVDLSQGLRRKVDRSTMTWNAAPALCGDTVVIGNQVNDRSDQVSGKKRNWNEDLPLGDVRGFNVHSGKQQWVFNTVPQAGEFGNDTWGNESWRWMGNTNVWSMMSCDAELGHIYLPVTAPTQHYYGGARPGNNLFSDAVVALDAQTGERVWHFQTLHHDIWDYDLPAAPVVADIEVDGKPVKAIVQVGKTGFVYVFDRLTGKPVWPIEERPVPQSTLAGEHSSPTQPFPSLPPPFELQGFHTDDLIDFTPAIRQKALQLVKTINTGPLFLPPSELGSLIMPGIAGGASWGGAAFDPETHMLYVTSFRMPFVLTAKKVSKGYKYLMEEDYLNVDGLPAVKPPWSSITAYTLDNGNIAWQVPNGVGPRDHELLKDLDLPDLGAIYEAPGLLVTKGAIFFGHTEELRDGYDQATTLRAVDKQTGTLLWQHAVSGSHFWAPPITYMAGGRQFIVVATGSSTEPARLTAFRLP